MQGLQCFRKQCLQGLIGQDLLIGGGQGLQRTIGQSLLVGEGRIHSVGYNFFPV